MSGGGADRTRAAAREVFLRGGGFSAFDPRHACDETCSFVPLPAGGLKLWGCRTHGTVHECGSARCPTFPPTPDGRTVCLLSRETLGPAIVHEDHRRNVVSPDTYVPNRPPRRRLHVRERVRGILFTLMFNADSRAAANAAAAAVSECEVARDLQMLRPATYAELAECLYVPRLAVVERTPAQEARVAEVADRITVMWYTFEHARGFRIVLKKRLAAAVALAVYAALSLSAGCLVANSTVFVPHSPLMKLYGPPPVWGRYLDRFPELDGSMFDRGGVLFRKLAPLCSYVLQAERVLPQKAQLVALRRPAPAAKPLDGVEMPAPRSDIVVPARAAPVLSSGMERVFGVLGIPVPKKKKKLVIEVDDRLDAKRARRGRVQVPAHLEEGTYCVVEGGAPPAEKLDGDDASLQSEED